MPPRAGAPQPIDTPESARLFWPPPAAGVRTGQTSATPCTRPDGRGRVFPLRDDNPTLLTPYVTWALVLANVAVWIFVEGAGSSPGVLGDAVCTYGAIPAEITGRTGGLTGVDLGPGVPDCMFGGLTWSAILTSMFMHGGWMHLISNMWVLWIFGNNIEDSMGHLRFLLFFVLCGVLAALAHVFSAPGSPIQTVGASGAISAVMGAYLLLYPRVRIHTLFIIIIFIKIIPVHAWLILVLWFVLQVISSTVQPATGGGVAFWAHIGGFVAGVILVKLFENRQLVEARRRHIRLSPYEIRHRGWY
jgi:membrane associated rhomboid family serine protease